MQTQKQPDRWESSIIAAALAVAGTLFLSDKLGSLMFASNLLLHVVQRTAPVLLVALGLTLLFADHYAVVTEASDQRQESSL